MKRLGLDLGTKNIVLAYRDPVTQKIKCKHEINGYVIFDKVDNFLEQLLVKQGVPFVNRGKDIIAIGHKAEKIAYTFQKQLMRPMAHGGINKNDDDAQEIMAIIIKAIIGKLDDDAVLYYCTTAAPVNGGNINVDFHRKVVKLMVEKYVSDGKISAHHINEARCLIIEEPGAAIGISWGAGTVTVHAGMFGVPIFEFCVVNSGDWVDLEVAKRFGYDENHPEVSSRETPTSICRRKHDIDLGAMPDDKVGQAIVLMYELLVENVVDSIVKGLKENRDKFRFDQPIPFVNAGGTSMPKGFLDLFKRVIEKRRDDINLPIGEIRHSEDPLFAVARGTLIACEMHKD